VYNTIIADHFLTETGNYMAWQSEILSIVRILINDLVEPKQYSDQRLLQVIPVAANYVQLDAILNNEYLIDVSTSSITPDPTTLESKDSVFTSLVALKTACIIDQSILRTKAATEGIRAALGPATLAVSGNLAAWKTILDNGPCATYDNLVHSLNIRDASAIRAILSPFVGNNFDPSMIVDQNPRGRNFFS
jgi:hypothetical protein